MRGEGNPIGMYRKKRKISSVLMNRRGEFGMTGIEVCLLCRSFRVQISWKELLYSSEARLQLKENVWCVAKEIR